MVYKRLLIWVEGNDDLIFFENILREKFEEHYSEVRIREYCGDQIKGEAMNQMVCKLIKALEDDRYRTTNEGRYCPQEYILVKDFDFCTCYTNKKIETEELVPHIDKNKILIVKNMIESWYLAGLSEKNCRKSGIPYNLVKKNQNLQKDTLYTSLPKEIKKYKRNFLITLTKKFDFNEAKKNNDSFKYFVEKFGLS